MAEKSVNHFRRNTMTIKQYAAVTAVLLCLLALCFASCLNPTVEDPSGKLSTGAVVDVDDGGEDNDGEENEEGEEDEDRPVTHKSFAVNAVSGLPVTDNNTNAAGMSVATLAMPEKDGPWTPALITGVDDNDKFEIAALPAGAEGETAYEVRIKDGPLPLGPYKVSVNISNEAGTIFHRIITFSVALTPPPLTKAPVVYPHITGPGKNKLAVSWDELPLTAQGYQLYVGTSENSAQAQPYGSQLAASVKQADITDIEGDSTDGGLPDGTTYYVWVLAYNAEGESAFGPYGKRATSAALHEGFYKDPQGNSFYSWDSYSGDMGTGKGGADFYIITEPNAEHPGGFLRYGPELGGILNGYKGEIVYHATGNMTGRSKWGETLTGPSGVLIVRYENRKPGLPGDYQGVYYYGLGTIQTVGKEGGNTFGPAPDRDPVGLELCYFGNSYDLKAGANPETETLEKAIDKFTLANVNKYIAFVAVPWYRKYDAGSFHDD
jgi:hypothetical protein